MIRLPILDILTAQSSYNSENNQHTWNLSGEMPQKHLLCRGRGPVCAWRHCSAAVFHTHAGSARRTSRLQNHRHGHSSSERRQHHTGSAVLREEGGRDSHPQGRRCTSHRCHGMGHQIVSQGTALFKLSQYASKPSLPKASLDLPLHY